MGDGWEPGRAGSLLMLGISRSRTFYFIFFIFFYIFFFLQALGFLAGKHQVFDETVPDQAQQRLHPRADSTISQPAAFLFAS